MLFSYAYVGSFWFRNRRKLVILIYRIKVHLNRMHNENIRLQLYFVLIVRNSIFSVKVIRQGYWNEQGQLTKNFGPQSKNKKKKQIQFKNYKGSLDKQHEKMSLPYRKHAQWKRNVLYNFKYNCNIMLLDKFKERQLDRFGLIGNF